MRTRTYLTKSVSLIILAAMLLGLFGVAPASAQEGIALAVSGGDNQSAVIGTPYTLMLQVTVTSAAGPVAGAAVEFAAPSSGASIVPDTFTVTTDDAGVASVFTTANWYAGAFEVYASYGGQTAALHLTNVGTLGVSGGGYQSAVIGAAYAEPLQAKVTDAAGPVAGAVVEFVAPSTGASLNPAAFTATTGADGVVSAAATANGYAGTFEVRANYGGQTAVYHLINTGTLRLAISGGDEQSAVIGAAYALPLQVTVTEGGAPVAGAVVQFVAPSSGASLNPATFTATTDASGMASAAVTANGSEGFFEVLASYGGQSTVFFLNNTGTLTSGDETIIADNPDYIESHCEFNDGIAAGDPSVNGNEHRCTVQTNQEDCEHYKYCWWHDTTNQNAISQHSADEYDASVTIVWQDGDKLVAAYSSQNGANVAVVVDGNEYALVGCGGAQATAQSAKAAFNAAIPGFNRKVLKAVVAPTYADESYRWCSYWTKFQPIPVYVHASMEQVRIERSIVASEYYSRTEKMYGQLLTWGVDSLLGVGSMKVYKPGSLGSSVPLTPIAEDTTVTLGTTDITLILTSEDDRLLTHLPAPGILIAPHMGKFLPDVGSLRWRSPRVLDSIATLNKILGLGPGYVVPLNGLPIVGEGTVHDALTMQRDALLYLLDHTIELINQHTALEDIVDTVKLPPQLQGPYTQELVGAQAHVVRQVYQEYMGWFDGNVAHLESLPSFEKAARLIEFGGGENAVLSYVKKCLGEHTRAGLIEAVDKLSALRMVHPSATADAYYIQALKMLAWTTPNAPERNWYLTEAQTAASGVTP